MARLRRIVFVVVLALSALPVLASPASASQQPGGSQVWVARGDGDAFSAFGAFSPDGATVVVAATVSSSEPRDFIRTTAYGAAHAAKKWTTDLALGQSCGVTAMAYSPDGATVFIGGSFGVDGDASTYWVAALSGTTGAVEWSSEYGGPLVEGIDILYGLAVSPDGSRVFVTGQSEGVGTGPDYATVSFDAATGVEEWAQRYDGPGHYNDWAHAVAVSPDGSTVVVTGTSLGPDEEFDYATIAYDAATGARRWVRRVDHAYEQNDDAMAVAVTPDGSTAIVTGRQLQPDGGNAFGTVAYNTTTGNELWSVRAAPTAGGYATALGVSPDGLEAIVAGKGPPDAAQPAFATAALRTADGSTSWKHFAAQTTDATTAAALAITPDGRRIIVTGSVASSGASDDYLTVCYDTTTGARKWSARYDGGSAIAPEDHATSIALSPDGRRVAVTGLSRGKAGRTNATTVLYTI